MLLCPWDSLARILEWVAILFSRGSSQPRTENHISCVFCIGGRFFTQWAIGEALLVLLNSYKFPLNMFFKIIHTLGSNTFKAFSIINLYIYHYLFEYLPIHPSIHPSICLPLYLSNSFSSVQSLSHVWLFATPWIAARQASLSTINSQISLKLTSIESVIPSSHLILYRPLLLLPQSLPASESFPMSQLLAWGGKVLEFQL